MRGEHVWQALVHLRRLIGTAAEDHGALLARAHLDRSPIDDTGSDDLLGPPLPHLGVRMVRAALTCVPLRRHGEPAITPRPRVPRSVTPAARRLRAAHPP